MIEKEPLWPGSTTLPEAGRYEIRGQSLLGFGGVEDGDDFAVMDVATGMLRWRLRDHDVLPADDQRWLVIDCLSPTHEERATHDAASLLRRIEGITGLSRAPRLPRLRPRRWQRPAMIAAAVATAMLGVTAYLAWDDGPTYGYHRCPVGSVCFFSEPNGTGEMCSWTGDDPNWLTGKETCGWTREQPVRSIFNNNQETTADHDVAYYRGTNFTPAGYDLSRPTQRTGCTGVNQQGNLAGTYAPLSHRWVEHC